MKLRDFSVYSRSVRYTWEIKNTFIKIDLHLKIKEKQDILSILKMFYHYINMNKSPAHGKEVNI